MDNTDTVNPILPMLVGSGIAGLLISIAVLVIGFIISAFITALWVRLILVFMRKTLDREYGRMRMASLGFSPKAPRSGSGSGSGSAPLREEPGPRDW